MKRIYYLLSIGFLFYVLFVPFSYASSQRAYQDYLFQFDSYRQKYSDFKIAKNEYEKFHSLASQTDALTKTTAMLGQRDQLLRAYLLLLQERLNEDLGLNDTDKGIYQTLLSNEISFLDKHSALVSSIATIEDTMNVSRELESHYAILQASIRQTIIGISVGGLTSRARLFDTTLADMKALAAGNRDVFTPEKQATIDRWILQISNTQNLYRKKIDSILSANAQLHGSNIDDQDLLFGKLKRNISEARQYLIEGTSYSKEVVQALKYQNE